MLGGAHGVRGFLSRAALLVVAPPKVRSVRFLSSPSSLWLVEHSWLQRKGTHCLTRRNVAISGCPPAGVVVCLSTGGPSETRKLMVAASVRVFCV